MRYCMNFFSFFFFFLKDLTKNLDLDFRKILTNKPFVDLLILLFFIRTIGERAKLNFETKFQRSHVTL